MIGFAGCSSENSESPDSTATEESSVDPELRTPITEFVAAFENEDKRGVIDSYHPDAPSIPSRDNIYFPDRITLDSLNVVEQSSDAAVVRANLTLTDDSGDSEQVVHTYELRPNDGEWDIYYFVVGTEIPDTDTDTGGDTESSRTPSVVFQKEYQESKTEGSTTGILTITHASGETLRGSNVYIRGSGIVAVEGATPDVTSRNTQWTSATGTEEITAGESVTVGVENDFEISVVWESGETSETLTTSSGPGA
jgi:hypothetical protein